VATYQRLSDDADELNEADLSKSDASMQTHQSVDNSMRLSSQTSPLRRANTKRIAEIAQNIMEGIGVPLTRARLVEALEHRDIELPSKDKARYIGTIMWRNRKTFVNLDGFGYWIRELPCEAVGYDPMGARKKLPLPGLIPPKTESLN
jgi:hypothetical protein